MSIQILNIPPEFCTLIEPSGGLLTTAGGPIKYGPEILQLLEAQSFSSNAL